MLQPGPITATSANAPSHLTLLWAAPPFLFPGMLWADSWRPSWLWAVGREVAPAPRPVLWRSRCVLEARGWRGVGGRDDPGREGGHGEREREGRGEGEGAARREATHRARAGAGVAAGGEAPGAGLGLGFRAGRGAAELGEGRRLANGGSLRAPTQVGGAGGSFPACSEGTVQMARPVTPATVRTPASRAMRPAQGCYLPAN